MTMDPDRCVEVQQAISAAYDGEPVDAGALASAKTHCTECAECAAFVTLLAEIRRLPEPEVPEEVFGRVLDAVRLEAARSSTPAPQAELAPAAQNDRRVTSPVPPRERWRAWVPWAAAAAVFFVAAGVVTVQGVRYLLAPTSAPLTSDATVEVTDDDRARNLVLPDDSASDAGADTGALSAEEQAYSLEADDGPAYVTLADRAYRFDSAVDSPATPAAGQVTSSLDSGGVAVTRQVFTEPGSDAIIVEADEGVYLRFVPVTRTLRGRAFELSSPMVTAFGIWPSLPPGIPQPTSPDGAPDFVPAGTDDAGVAVFALPGSDVSSGFAVAPDTSPNDPAAGNPGWTWWVPATR